MNGQVWLPVDERTALCDRAWAEVRCSPDRRRWHIEHGGRPYVVTLSQLRLLVHTPDGEPVAARWHS